MFRVPLDAENPTFDRAEKISVRRWLASSRTDRAEWKRRRNLAAATAAAIANTRYEGARDVAKAWSPDK